LSFSPDGEVWYCYLHIRIRIVLMKDIYVYIIHIACVSLRLPPQVFLNFLSITLVHANYITHVTFLEFCWILHILPLWAYSILPPGHNSQMYVATFACISSDISYMNLSRPYLLLG
jgi:hypothetical protein